MLNIYHSNNMQLLKTLLIQLIKHDPLDDVFAKETILVQSTGISQWLKIGLASEVGIAANVKFPLPASFLWDMFNLVLPEIPKESAFSKDLMKWKIMKLLPAALELDAFLPIKNYLCNDKTGVKALQLSDKIADLYDQYSVFRPEWISEWEQGQWDESIVGNHLWQPMLWKMLVDYTQELGQPLFHRANMYETFIQRVKSGNFPTELLPKRLFVMGISSLPPRFLDALEALGEHIDIHLMFSNPCRYYWGDIKDRKYLAKLAAKHRKKIDSNLSGGRNTEMSQLLKDNSMYEADSTLDASVGNSLLASMGKTGRDYLSLLSEKSTSELDAFIDIERDSLLHCIQADILNLEDKSQSTNFDDNLDKGVVDESDRSLTFHGCFSPQREVEALHNFLLTKFNEDTSTVPQDVVVMVSDIDKYSPHIHSVFGGAPHERFIPFSVSDRTATSESPLLQVFLDLLSIGIGRQECSKVIEILEVPAIMRKFGLEANELSTLTMWIEQAGVRWGLDQNTAIQNGLPAPDANHWLFGINRMIMGYAIPHEDGAFGGVLGYDESQGSAAEMAGKLGHFIDSLISLRDTLNSSFSVDGWITNINNLIDTFFDIEKEEAAAIETIRSKVSEFYRVIEGASYSEKIPTEIVFRHFNGIFSKDRLSQHFMVGKVTFCTLMPMRSIPFKHVCLLGMNDGDYPRASQAEGFDLISAFPQIGDRSRRDDDRYLFLEAILSAQDSLYISYVSRKVQDNTEKNPSVLVSELLEYIQKGYCLLCDTNAEQETAEANITKLLSFSHPLTAFSPSNFNGEYKSFEAEWTPASEISQTKRHKDLAIFLSRPLPNILATEAASDGVIKLDISELLRFWSMPVKHFFTRRLKVNFDVASAGANDDEAFDLDAKTAFPIKRQWLDSLIEGAGNTGCALSDHEKSQIHSKMLTQFGLEGILPYGEFGTTAMEDLKQNIEQLSESVIEKSKDEIEHHIDLRFTFEDCEVHLTGWSRRLYASGALYYRAGSLRPQDILQAWVQHLAINASGHTTTTSILTLNESVFFPEMTPDISMLHLHNLVAGYNEGMCRPLTFLPRTSYAAIKAGHIKKENTFLNTPTHGVYAAIEQSFNGGFEGISGEGENPYISRVWEGVDESLCDEIYKNSLRYLSPPIRYMTKL